MTKWTYDVISEGCEIEFNNEVVETKEEAIKAGMVLAERLGKKEFCIAKVDPLTIPKIRSTYLEEALHYLFTGREYDSYLGDSVLMSWISDSLRSKEATDKLVESLEGAVSSWAQLTNRVPNQHEYWYVEDVERVPLLPKLFIKDTRWNLHPFSYWEQTLATGLPLRIFAMVHGITHEEEKLEMEASDYFLYIITPGTISADNTQLFYDIYAVLSKYPHKLLMIATIPQIAIYISSGLGYVADSYGLKFEEFPDDKGRWMLKSKDFSPEEKMGIERLRKTVNELHRANIHWVNTIEEVINFFREEEIEGDMYS